MQQANHETESPKLLRRTVLKSTAAGAALGVVGTRVLADEDDDNDENDEEELDVSEDEEYAAVIFPTQVTDGTSLEIEYARLPEGGFVSIVDPVAAHEDLWPIEGETMPSLEDTVAAQIKGATPYLEPGEHMDVEIEPDEPLEGEKLYQVFVHPDTTGDETFAFIDSVGEEDFPYPMEFGPGVAEDVDSDEETIPPGTQIEFEAQTGGWVGIAPDEIAGEQNPTVSLAAGEEYEIGWTEGDGVAHNIEIRDEEGDVVDGLSTDVVSDPGDGQWLEFEASEEMAAYVCAPHAGTMNGPIDVVDLDDADDDADDEEEADDEANDEENDEEEEVPAEIADTQVPNIVMGDAYLHRLEDVPDEEMPADEEMHDEPDDEEMNGEPADDKMHDEPDDEEDDEPAEDKVHDEEDPAEDDDPEEREEAAGPGEPDEEEDDGA